MSRPIKITATGKYLSATSTSSRVILPGTDVGEQILVYNSSSVLAFVKWGDSSVEAVAGTSAPDIPVPPGVVMTLTRPQEATYVAGITDSGTATLYFHAGEGE